MAYCDRAFEIAVRQTAGAGAIVVTCPPLAGVEFVAQYRAEIEAADLIIFNFDAMPAQPRWYLQNGQIAMHAAELQDLNLSRVVVFMLNCYQGGGMLDALKATKPKAIIAGAGENLGGKTRAVGTDVLALWFRRWLALGLPVDTALSLAKARLKIGAQTASVKDAQQFEVIT